MSAAPSKITHVGLPALRFAGSHGSSVAAIVWLHGAGERGTDPALIANYGLPAALDTGRAFTSCDVLCPQLPEGEEWGVSLVRSIVLEAKPRYETIVLIGYSLGGLGVLELVANCGSICALQVSIASGPPHTPVPVVSQAGVHLHCIQGEHDIQSAVSSFVGEVRRLGGYSDQEIIAGGNHFISEAALSQPKLQSALASRGIVLQQQAASNTKTT